MDGNTPAASPVSPDEDHADLEHERIVSLTRQLEDARLLAESYQASLQLQGMRGDGLQFGLDQLRRRIEQLERSFSWKITKPVRNVRAFAAGRLPSGRSFSEAAKRIAAIAREEGAAGLVRRSTRRFAVRRPVRLASRSPTTAFSSEPASSSRPWEPYSETRPPEERKRLVPSILIVAELSIPQCSKYRVWQKQELFRSLGWECRVIDWHQIDIATTALQLCSDVVFYRVPGVPEVLQMIREAKRVGLDPWWEVDDLIFDEPLYRQNSNLATLAPALRAEVLNGVRLYRQAMLACRRTIASTSRLADCMRRAGIETVHVVENALDAETLSISTALREERAARLNIVAPDIVTIVYGSGTKTHDADFACAAPAILALLQRHSHLRLRIVGELTLPASFEALAGRIETLPSTSYRLYLGLLAEADIAIAPLEPTVFNDAKSNIKFQEAAILGIPSVVSPRQAFLDIVVPGRADKPGNGLLAETPEEWEEALERLILDPALRQSMGDRACRDVLAHYAPERIAQTQLAPLAGMPVPEIRRKLRILSANIFFAPQSFGGATIVAQEMAARLNEAADVEVFVFASRPGIPGRPNSLLRYNWNGIPVFAASLSPPSDQVVQLDNVAMADTFGRVLDVVRPDVVHAHSIQGFGAGILRLCRERGIPYVVTLHDAWWLCDRQFMVQGNNHYCFQTKIDLRVCQNCLPHAHHLGERMRIMMGALGGASLLLSPSESHRQLYLANGLPPDRLKVNRNGIRLPARPRTPRVAGSKVRFGFVGGNEAIKGFHLIRRAFEKLTLDNWQLVLVDNTLNLGFRSIDVSSWKVQGTIEVIPAYDQNSLDAFFDRIDVLLFPSQWKESFGLSVREALVRNVWVIATRDGGQAEDIEDGVNGRLIDLDGTADGLLEAVSELLLVPQSLDGYLNPSAGSIATYAGQSDELLGMLRSVVPAGAAGRRAIRDNSASG